MLFVATLKEVISDVTSLGCVAYLEAGLLEQTRSNAEHSFNYNLISERIKR